MKIKRRIRYENIRQRTKLIEVNKPRANINRNVLDSPYVNQTISGIKKYKNDKVVMDMKKNQ